MKNKRNCKKIKYLIQWKTFWKSFSTRENVNTHPEHMEIRLEIWNSYNRSFRENLFLYSQFRYTLINTATKKKIFYVCNDISHFSKYYTHYSQMNYSLNARDDFVRHTLSRSVGKSWLRSHLRNNFVTITTTTEYNDNERTLFRYEFKISMACSSIHARTT